VVREESHLDDMRAAIRGDFERLEERRGEQELMRPIAEREPATPQRVRPGAELPGAPTEPAAEPQQSLAIESDEPVELPERSQRRSWLDRLLGR
jgi:hypothetical protein